MIGKLDPKDGKLTRFPMPDENEFWFGVDTGYLARARYQDKS